MKGFSTHSSARIFLGFLFLSCVSCGLTTEQKDRRRTDNSQDATRVTFNSSEDVVPGSTTEEIPDPDGKVALGLTPGSERIVTDCIVVAKASAIKMQVTEGDIVDKDQLMLSYRTTPQDGSDPEAKSIIAPFNGKVSRLITTGPITTSECVSGQKKFVFVVAPVGP